MNYSEETKQKVKERLQNAYKPKEISEEFGISTQTIYRWRKEILSEEKDKPLDDRKKVKKLIRLRKIEESVKIIEKYPLSPIMQSQRINIYISRGEYSKAKKIGSREEFKDNPIIQGQMTKIANIEKDYSEVRRIASNEKFINNEIIQTQLVEIALRKDNPERRNDVKVAKEIGKRKEFQNNEIMQLKILIIAIIENDYKTIYKIDKNFPDNPKIQKRIIQFLMLHGDVEEARKRGERKIFENNSVIQSLMMKIDIEERKFEDAKRKGEKENFKNDSYIQSQMITIDVKEGKWEEAIERGSKQNFKNNQIIQTQLKNIKIEKKEKEEFLNKLKTKLYFNKVEPSDIQQIKDNNTLSDEFKVYILLAIYEKDKKAQSAKQLINLYKKHHPNSEQIKKFNNIMQRISSNKKTIFDYNFYDRILGWNMDENLRKTYEQEKEKEDEMDR